MAAANATSQCLVHTLDGPIITGMRCCCQADQVLNCGATPTTMASAKGSGSIRIRSRATSAAKTSSPGRKNRDCNQYASCTVDGEDQGDLHRFHTPRSSSRSLRADHGLIHPGFAQLPTEIWEMITSASQQQHLPTQNKEIGGDCMADNRHDGSNAGHDFILFDDSTRPHFSKNPRGDCLEHDVDEIMDSIEIGDATERRGEPTPHLQRPPPPRPKQLLTPNFTDDEEMTTFFEPLDMVGHRQRKSRNDLRCNEEWTSLF